MPSQSRAVAGAAGLALILAAFCLPVRGLHYGQLILLSPSVVGAFKAFGIILVIGLLICQGAIAFLLTRRFNAMPWVAVAMSLAAPWSGPTSASSSTARWPRPSSWCWPRSSSWR
ncbi:metal ABC transporter permease [Achromobacter xylosoxidans]|uniref:metal ABC transporter permease n=2 Tax=Pseudomonadota TaxID=1224 RepID=UPI001B38ACE1|nr:metal ABC transporter permease [Achromobacter xylosoxidans]MBP8322422.1 metal ABC transporter permease [Pseudomonas aeruginosa]MCZ8441706.1 metal ABC transporter permease [Achromobacter xylosoxidans]MDC6160400.1 metal ABC transporter permease [Achromobacter xylosoxidans]